MKVKIKRLMMIIMMISSSKITSWRILTGIYTILHVYNIQLYDFQSLHILILVQRYKPFCVCFFSFACLLLFMFCFAL